MMAPAPQEEAGARPPGSRSLRALEHELARAQKLAALGALVARLAHEVGTPLHSMAGHLDLLLAADDIAPRHRQRIEIVSGEVQRLSQLIRRYLQRLQAPEPRSRPTDLPALIRRVLRLLDPVLLRHKVETTTDFAPGTEAPFSCDPRQVEQVVLNLVQNAVDAMPHGGTLAVRCGLTASGRALSVADSGEGIRPELREHVMEPFFSTKPSERGSGLGLAICQEIARAHGGDVRIDSQPGVGTVVTITLEPVGAAASGAEAPRESDA